MKLRNLRWGDYPGGPSVIISIFIQRTQEVREERCCIADLEDGGRECKSRMVAGFKSCQMPGNKFSPEVFRRNAA